MFIFKSDIRIYIDFLDPTLVLIITMSKYDTCIHQIKTPSITSLSKAKKTQNNTSPLTPIKLNSNKLPGDFFGKIAKVPPLPPKANKKNKLKSQTDRKAQEKNRQTENVEEFLPDAQATSFFRMIESEEIKKIPHLPSFNKFHSDTKIHANSLGVQEIRKEDDNYTISIEFKTDRDSLENIQEMLYTFAKKSELEIAPKTKTPLKKNYTINEQSFNTIKAKRKSREGARQKEYLYQRYRQIEDETEIKTAKKSESRSKSQRIYESIVLPRINKNSNQ